MGIFSFRHSLYGPLMSIASRSLLVLHAAELKDAVPQRPCQPPADLVGRDASHWDGISLQDISGGAGGQQRSNLKMCAY